MTETILTYTDLSVATTRKCRGRYRSIKIKKCKGDPEKVIYMRKRSEETNPISDNYGTAF